MALGRVSRIACGRSSLRMRWGVSALALAAAAALMPAGAPAAAAAGTVAGSASIWSTGPVLLASKPLRTTCSATFVDGDRRLGPEQLPNHGRVGGELKGYRRFGSMTAPDFLATYYDAAVGSWIYPPQNGYQLRPDGTPVVWRRTLRVGRVLDRFGSEYGSFLSPAGTPYARRAIPPSNLTGTPAEDCNYRQYRVVRSFDVAAGPIAAWFAQPGDGWQYQLSGAYVSGAPEYLNVLWLVDNGYLERVD